MQMWNGLGNVEGVGKIKAANANLKIEEKVDTLEFMKANKYRGSWNQRIFFQMLNVAPISLKFIPSTNM